MFVLGTNFSYLDSKHTVYCIHFLWKLYLQTEDDAEKELDFSKSSIDNHNGSPDGESCISETPDPGVTEDSTHNSDIHLLKQRFVEKLHKLSNLKRKSDEFLQKSYYADILNPEKRPKTKEKPFSKQNNHMLQTYENLKNLYEEKAIDVSYNTQSACNSDKELNDKTKDQSPVENNLELKTECDDMDIIVTDPAVCTTPKSYDSSRDGKKDLPLPLDYQSPQDSKYFIYCFVFLLSIHDRKSQF